MLRCGLIMHVLAGFVLSLLESEMIFGLSG
jgi:hypothetical protein